MQGAHPLGGIDLFVGVTSEKFFSYFSGRFNNSRMRIRMYAFRVDINI